MHKLLPSSISVKGKQEDQGGMKIHLHTADFQPNEKKNSNKYISEDFGRTALFFSVRKCFLCLLLCLHQTFLNTCSAIYTRIDETQW